MRPIEIPIVAVASFVVVFFFTFTTTLAVHEARKTWQLEDDCTAKYGSLFDINSVPLACKPFFK